MDFAIIFLNLLFIVEMAQTTMEKIVPIEKLKTIFSEINENNYEKNVKVIILLEDKEDIEIAANQEKLHQEMKQSLHSGISSFTI